MNDLKRAKKKGTYVAASSDDEEEEDAKNSKGDSWKLL